MSLPIQILSKPRAVSDVYQSRPADGVVGTAPSATPRTRLRWRLPDAWAMALTVVAVIVLLSWASAIYGGPGMSTVEGFTIQHPRPNVVADWDTPVGNGAGYGHAAFLLGVRS